MIRWLLQQTRRCQERCPYPKSPALQLRCDRNRDHEGAHRVLWQGLVHSWPTVEEVAKLKSWAREGTIAGAISRSRLETLGVKW